MNKILRGLLLSLLMVFCGTTFAQTVTFVAGTDVGTLGTSGTGADEVSKDGVTIAITGGTLSRTDNYRIYKGNTLTISSTIGNITKVEITATANDAAQYGPGCFVASDGNYTYEGKVGTWTGDAASLSLNASLAQVRATQIVVTVGEGGGTVEPEPTPEVNSIAEFKALAQNKEAKLTLSNAKVVYCWTSSNGNVSAYVRDASGAIVFDCRGDYSAIGQNFATGNDINGSIILKNVLYNKLPQASATANTNVENLTIAAGSAVTPVTCTVTDSKNYLCDLVTIQGVNVTSDGAEKPKYYATSGDDQIQIYNGFHLTAFDDLSTFVGENKTVTGIMIVYNTTYEIYPIEDGITTTGINNPTTNVLDNNAPVYNLAGQRVSKDAKGILIKNGKKIIK